MENKEVCPYCGSSEKEVLGRGELVREFFPASQRPEIGDEDEIVWCSGCRQYYGVAKPLLGESKSRALPLPGKFPQLKPLPIALGV